jgi:hypothetical protein
MSIGGKCDVQLECRQWKREELHAISFVLPANYISDVVVSAVARKNQSEELAPIWLNRGGDPTFCLFAVDNMYRRTWPSDISKVPGGPGPSDLRLSGISKPPLQTGITEL